MDPVSPVGVGDFDPDAIAASLVGDGMAVDAGVIGGYFNDRNMPTGPAVQVAGGVSVPTPLPGQGNQRIEPYREGDQWSMLQNMSTSQRVALQDRLANLQFLSPGYRRGFIDDRTLDAIGDVMTLANREGRDFYSILMEQEQRMRAGDELLAGGTPGSQRGRVYSMPDTTSLKNRVRTQFQSTLGRDPTQAEMRMFAESLMSDYQSLVSQQQEADEFGETGAGRELVQTQVDPVSRFNERFQQYILPEQTSTLRQQGANTAAGLAEQAISAAEAEVL